MIQGMSRKDEGRLERIAGGINNSEHNSFGDKLKKIPYILLAVYYGGVLVPEYQEEFAERIGGDSKNLTMANATIFGLGGSALYFFGGGELLEFFGTINPLKDAENYFVVAISNMLGVTAKTLLNAYVSYNTLQSLGRIGYSQKTKKAAPSFSFNGAIFNGGHASFRLLKRSKACGGS